MNKLTEKIERAIESSIVLRVLFCLCAVATFSAAVGLIVAAVVLPAFFVMTSMFSLFGIN